MEQVAGVILAGGLSRRMNGQDKAFALLAGRPMMAHVIERLGAQAAPAAISANGDPARFGAFGLPVIADAASDFAGPLAGILAGMIWTRKTAPGARFVATAACDTPFFPLDAVSRLLAAAGGAYPVIVLPRSCGRTHPMSALWPVALASNLENAIAGGARKVLDWVGDHPNLTVEFDPDSRLGALADPFFNANTPEELAAANAAMSARMHKG